MEQKNFVTLGRVTVSKVWADAHTGNEDDARETMMSAYADIAIDHFRANAWEVIDFIWAKYPNIRL